MTAFWLVAAILVVACMAWLLAPLLRPASSHVRPDPLRAALVLRYRAEVADLDDAVRAGTLDATSRADTQRLLSHRLVEETDALQHDPAVPQASPMLAGLLLAVLPAGAILLYLQLGNPLALKALDPAAIETMSSATPGAMSDGAQPDHAISPVTIEAMVARLAFRLRDDRDDAEGWYMLARSYAALDRFGDAAAAYGRAVKLVPDSAMLRADYADALASAGGGTLDGPPMVQIEAALRIDPEEPKALALAATAAAERGDTPAAIRYWERLQPLLPADSQTAARVAANLTVARSGMAAAAPTATTQRVTDRPSSPLSADALEVGGNDGGDDRRRDSTGRALRAASATNTSNMSNMSNTQNTSGTPSPTPPAATGATVTGTVALATGSKLQPRPGDTLYVIARATDGSRMPLAVWRGTIQRLPMPFVLDDSLAMTPERLLSSQREIRLEARVSASGKAMAQPGDLLGRAGTVAVGSTDVRIVIDSVVPDPDAGAQR